ncbi:proline iminopeptidase-family hydrolase [Streptomyces afghaniensis]|uniref:proline iminopeptidase-family hydrolase n=1 Tax=Streptomyces afghaniensis TaxID=66865 RepID=UPI00278AC873|nr:proline iminopeptidase-family hydrolase [Streptomyces afghaniensis]MDQ1015675.1 proline-specific peptidase [Streptomyces afghaniensis]
MSDLTSGARCAVPGGRIWYDILNPDAPGTPVVTVHGGPGTPHDYLRPLADALPGHPVVVYDQSGCGRSARTADEPPWRLERFVDELDALVGALGLRRFHLLGHSFGTMIACDFALRGTHRPDWLVLVSPVLNVRKYEEDMRQLLFRLPSATAQAISDALRTDRYDTDAYREASLVFAERHMCRADWPDALLDATLGTSEEVRDALWGPTEFRVTGSLRSYTRSERLPELDVPALFVSGEHDFVPARACQAYARAVPRGQTAVIANASHMPHLEEPELFAKELLSRIGDPA